LIPLFIHLSFCWTVSLKEGKQNERWLSRTTPSEYIGQIILGPLNKKAPIRIVILSGPIMELENKCMYTVYSVMVYILNWDN
jgi:hypothetical protein